MKRFVFKCCKCGSNNVGIYIDYPNACDEDKEYIAECGDCKQREKIDIDQ